MKKRVVGPVGALYPNIYKKSAVENGAGVPIRVSITDSRLFGIGQHGLGLLLLIVVLTRLPWNNQDRALQETDSGYKRRRLVGVIGDLYTKIYQR